MLSPLPKFRALRFALLLATGMSGLWSTQACSFPSYRTSPAEADAGVAGENVGGATGENVGGAAAGSPVFDDERCIACAAEWADCNGLAEDGCETSLRTVSDCGTCGLSCTNAHGTNACASSWDGDSSPARCQPSCAAGFLDCDLRSDNGCETNLSNDVLNCGACGRACPANGGTPLCVGGQCGVSACNFGFADCASAGACTFNLARDPLNCGRCGNVCSSVHGTARCNAGVCEIDCKPGYGDCNATLDRNDGCETTLNVPDAGGSVPNCGACGALCQRRSLTTVNVEQCAMGVCSRECFDGTLDCTENRDDASCAGKTCGCEFAPCP